MKSHKLKKNLIKMPNEEIKDLKREIAEDYRKIDKLENRKYIQIVALLIGIMIMVFLYILLAY